ncbi:MAG: LysR family transcriptional regulator [Huintestinicola sp.]|uniref:LysR family transcriptional regulator n=1 Tax=Huintestinicola sp. TaxID=2981661 RepID=UPI003F01E541
MELLQLKYFYALAAAQHVTRTAEQLHIAQPSLTQTIHRLESELGVKLFRTSGRNIVLTEYGVYLRDKLEPVLKSINEIPEELHALAGERENLIRVNVLAASNLITDAIIEYQKLRGDVRFQIHQHNEEENSDITVFTREFFRQPQNKGDRYYIFSEEIFLAVPKSSPYAMRESVSLSEMSDRKFIALAGSKGLRSICDRFCMQAGFRPDVIFESDSTSAVKNLIGANIGVGFWPHYTWEKPDEGSMALIPISDPVCGRDIIIRLHSDSADHAEAVRYFKYLTDFFDRLKK